MAVTANTNETYDVTTIREDLASAMASISPTETIFMSSIGTRNAENTYFEWSEVDLAATGVTGKLKATVGCPTQRRLMLFAKAIILKFLPRLVRYPQLITR